MATERAAGLAILTAGIPDVDAADLAAAQQILAPSRRLGSRQRDRAGELSVQLAEQAVTRQSRTG